MPGAGILLRTPLLFGGGIPSVFEMGSRVELPLLPALGADIHPINYAVAAMPSGSQGHVVFVGWSTIRLASAITSGATSATVTDDTGMPAAPFEIVIGNECITVGARTGTALSSLSRAQRGTTARRHLAGAKVASRPHAVVITSGATTWDYTARWGRRRGMKRTTFSPGGYGELSFSVMDRPTLTAAPTLGAEVEVSDAEGCYWQGIVDDVDIAWRPNGSAEVFIRCRGYAVTATDDVYMVSKTWPAYTAIWTIMAEARDALCPSISSDNSRMWGGGRSILVQSPDVIGKDAQTIWREMASQGDTEGIPIMHHVWRDGNGDPILETMRKPQLLRQYSVALGDMVGLRARYARSRVRNRIGVGFSGGYGQATGSTTPVGARRSLWVQAANQLDSYGVAQQVAETMLDAYENVVPQADAITIPYAARKPNTVTNTPTGFPIPLWRVDAGSHLTVTGAATGNAKLPVPSTFYVKATEFDYDRLQLTLQTEELMTVEGLTGQFLKSETARPDSPIHAPPAGAPVNMPDNASSPNLVSNIPSAATDRRLNHRKLAEGLDKITLLAVYGDGINEFTSDDIGAFGYLAHNTPYRLISAVVERDNATHTAGSIGVTFEKVPAIEGDGPPAGTVVGNVMIAGGFRSEFTFEQIVNDDPNLDVHLAPGDRVRWSIADSPAPDASSLLTIIVYAERMAGEKAQPTVSDPNIRGTISVSGLGAGVVNFTINTTQNCEVQVEYGESTDYGSFSAVSQMHTTHTIQIKGLATGVTYYYRIRLVDSHGNGNASAATGSFEA